MNPYNERYAKIYDILYSDKNYNKESNFINNLLIKHKFPKTCNILELACGTGNHAFELEKLGHKITGIDLSPHMIKIANRKKKEINSLCCFHEGDMRNLESYNLKNKFDIILCLFDSIGFAKTNDAIAQTLKGIKNLLSDNGIFIFEFWHAAAMIKNYEKCRIRRFIFNNKEIIRISETEINYLNQTCRVKYSVFVKENGKYDFFEDIQTNRFFLVQEMNAFLNNSGLTSLNYYNGFSDNYIIDTDAFHILGCAKHI